MDFGATIQMNNPKVRIMCVSNVFSRMMYFLQAGDVEEGHRHNFDHATLLSSGKLKIEILDEQNNVQSEKIFTAPDFVFIAKEDIHRLTALVDNTVAVCIHAMRDLDENIISPDSFVNMVRGDDLGKLVKDTNFPYQDPAIKNERKA